MIDWRSRERRHNNVPPSTNILIRCMKYVDKVEDSMESPIWMQRRADEDEDLDSD